MVYSDREYIMIQFLRFPELKLKDIVSLTKLHERQVQRKLKELMEEGRIIKKEHTYLLSDKNKVKILKMLPSHQDLARDVQNVIDEIGHETSKNKKFALAEKTLFSIMYCWVMLKTEWVYEINQTKKDRLDFDTYDVMFQSAMELIFEQLRPLDQKKSEALKRKTQKMFLPKIAPKM